MNEKLKEFLDKKRNDEKQRLEEEKQKILIELGLYEKVYSPENKYSEEFSWYEWDSVNSIHKYYKKVPYDITEDEYEEVIKYSKKENKSGSNIIAKIFKIIAWVLFVVGFIAGIIFGKLGVALAFSYWSNSFIIGMMFLGFSEIISLLNDIRNK